MKLQCLHVSKGISTEQVYSAISMLRDEGCRNLYCRFDCPKTTIQNEDYRLLLIHFI